MNTIQRALRPIILTELLFPLALLIVGIYHGVLQGLYRAGIIRADHFLGLGYYQGLTLHGVINAILLTTFFAVALANAIISQTLGGTVSVRTQWTALGLMIGGTLTAALPIFTGHASVLYTFYPPMKAHPAFYIGLAVVIVGSWVAFWGWIPPYLRWRRANPSLKTPLAALGMLTTFIVWQLCTLPVAYEVLVQLVPWSLGWVSGVNVVLARTLFWFFGHALVYFWLLPIYVLYYTVLPKLAGGKLYSDSAGRCAFLLFIVLSCPIGLHHQYSDPGIYSAYKALQAVLTLMVALPSLMTAFTVTASLEHGARQRGGRGLFAWWSALPYADTERWMFPYLFMGLVIFIFGGVTGLVNASYAMNNVIHNTAWLPAHFHLTVGGPVFLGILGMSLYLITGLLGKQVSHPRLALSVPYLWTLGTFIFSSGLFYGGIHGEPRRTNLGLSYLNPESPAYRPDWVTSTHIGALGGCLMGLAALIYFVVLIQSLRSSSSSAEAATFQIPQAEAYHDEQIPALQNLKPWIIAAVVLIVAAYTPALRQIVRDQVPAVEGYAPTNPEATSR